jgi:nucleotide-binding universal stress UspA family protein
MAQIFQRLLLATERTEFDAGAERLALALAQRCQRPLDVVMPLASNAEYEAVAPQLAAQADRDAAARLQPLREQARAAGVAIDLRVRRGADAWREIVDDARERDTDLIVIRRRGRRGFLARLLVGEMVGQVVAHAPCSVLVVPRDASLWTRRVLLAAEPGEAGETSLQLALAVAAECTLPLHLLCVAGSDAAARRSAEDCVADGLHRARQGGVPATGEVLAGAPAAQILEASRRHSADLLVLERGSVAHQVTGLVECAVLLTLDPVSKKDAPT